jgi:hypothetical protein
MIQPFFSFFFFEDSFIRYAVRDIHNLSYFYYKNFITKELKR